MSALIIQPIDSNRQFIRLRSGFTSLMVRTVIFLITVCLALPGKNVAQTKPSIKVKLNVLPSIRIAAIDADLKTLFAEDISHLNELVSVRTGGEEPISLDYGFSISAYENINVLLSFTRPSVENKKNQSAYPMRIVCGYINDGTTNFKRATISNKYSLQFRLRNNNLLKRSMKMSDPFFVAYTFFLVNRSNTDPLEDGALPVSTITLEYF